MAIKFSLMIALTIGVFSYAQANLDRYVRFSDGLEGHQERCFVKYALENEIRRYASEAVDREFQSDLKQLSDTLEDELLEAKESDESHSCKPLRNCYVQTIKRVRAPEDFGGGKFDDARCARWARFGQLCRMSRARKSPGAQKHPVERWVCHVRYDNWMSRFNKHHKCRSSIVVENQQRAEQEFESIFAYTKEELKKAEESLNSEIEAEDVERAHYNAKVTSDAHELIKNEISDLMPDYKNCLAKNGLLKVDSKPKLANSVKGKKILFW